MINADRFTFGEHAESSYLYMLMYYYFALDLSVVSASGRLAPLRLWVVLLVPWHPLLNTRALYTKAVSEVNAFKTAVNKDQSMCNYVYEISQSEKSRLC